MKEGKEIHEYKEKNSCFRVDFWETSNKKVRCVFNSGPFCSVVSLYALRLSQFIILLMRYCNKQKKNTVNYS